MKIIKVTPEVESVIIEQEKAASDAGLLPSVFDYSMLSTFASCPRRGFLSYIMHLKPVEPAHPLTFGASIHKGLEEYFKASASGAEKDEVRKRALEAFIEEARLDPSLPPLIKNEEKYDPRSVERGHNILSEYIDKCPLDNDTWVVESADDVEVGFAVLLDRTICPNCGSALAAVLAECQEQCTACGLNLTPITFVGKIDLIPRLKATRERIIVDHKTATRITEWYSLQWNPHDQLTGYMHGASELCGEKVRQAIINTLHFNKNILNVGVYYPTTRSDADIAEWQAETAHKVAALELMYSRWHAAMNGGVEAAGTHRKAPSLGSPAITHFPKNTSMCFFWFRKCPFHDMCSAGKPAMRDRLAKADFVERQWMPFEELNRGAKGVGVA